MGIHITPPPLSDERIAELKAKYKPWSERAREDLGTFKVIQPPPINPRFEAGALSRSSPNNLSFEAGVESRYIQVLETNITYFGD